MRVSWIGQFVVTLALATTAACSPEIRNNTVIDGWSIDTSAPANCAGPCTVYADKAIAQFDLDVPGHAAVVSSAVYREGLYPRGDGTLAGVVRSGGPFTVVVLRLADGGVAALGVQEFGEGRLWVLRRGPDHVD